MNKKTRDLVAVPKAIGALCLVILMVTVFVDVVGRGIFNKPLPWGVEVLEIVLAVMICTLYPVLALEYGHITVDLIKFPSGVQRFQRLLTALMGFALFSIICYGTALHARRTMDSGEATAMLHVRIAWIYVLMAILMAVTAVTFIVAGRRILGGAKVLTSVERELEAL